MTQTVFIKRGDTSPGVRASLKRADGTSPDLTGATVRFVMRYGANVVTNAVADILAYDTATVYYGWGPGDTAKAGQHRAEFEVTYADQSVETFPNSEYITVQIEQDLNGGD